MSSFEHTPGRSSSSPAPLDAGQLWTQFHGELWGFLRGRVKSDETCEDILQSAFLKAHAALEEGTQPAQPRAWLYTIVRNLMNDAFRHQGRQVSLREAYASDPGAHGDGAAELSPTRDAITPEQKEAFEQVARALPLFIDQLEPTYRDALRLTELEGLTQIEAAARAGVSLSCMKSRVQRARHMMHASLLRCCTFELDGRGRMIDCTRRSPAEPCSGCS